MSTADSYLLVSVQTCVHDIGKTFFPEMKDKTEILLSRIFSIILPLFLAELRSLAAKARCHISAPAMVKTR